MQTDSKSAIIILSFDIYFNAKRLKNGEFNYICKLFNVFARKPRSPPVYLLTNKISIFQMNGFVALV